MVDYKFERVKKLVSEFRPILAEEEKLRSIMDSYSIYDELYDGPSNWPLVMVEAYWMWEEKLKALQQEAVEKARKILVLK